MEEILRNVYNGRVPTAITIHSALKDTIMINMNADPRIRQSALKLNESIQQILSLPTH